METEERNEREVEGLSVGYGILVQATNDYTHTNTNTHKHVPFLSSECQWSIHWVSFPLQPLKRSS